VRFCNVEIFGLTVKRQLLDPGVPDLGGTNRQKTECIFPEIVSIPAVSPRGVILKTVPTAAILGFGPESAIQVVVAPFGMTMQGCSALSAPKAAAPINPAELRLSAVADIAPLGKLST
jgi:hypothetical protein